MASALFRAPGIALRNIAAFVAVHRLGAGAGWVGVISGSVYAGFLWNGFVTRSTSRRGEIQNIGTIALLAAMLALVAAFTRTKNLYGVIVSLLFALNGLYEVKYNILVRRLYDPLNRSKRLSRRFMTISAVSMLLSAMFGRLSSTAGNHALPFLIGSVLNFGAALVYRTQSLAENDATSYRSVEMIRALIRDQRLRRIVGLLVLYGWVGTGFKAIAVFVYSWAGFDEWTVGIQEGISTAGILLAALLITPHIRFRGAVSNFRLCFLTAAAGVAFCFAVVLLFPFEWAFAGMAISNLCYGISAAGFSLAMQTIAPNIAKPEQNTLYINTIMFFQGVRGLVLPILVSAAAEYAGLPTILVITLVIGGICVGVVMIPGIDGQMKSIS